MIKEVIRIDAVDKPKKELKPIKFTHLLSIEEGWRCVEQKDKYHFGYIVKVVYLGRCSKDGDMFAVYYSHDGAINIFKGHLNDGVYESQK